MSTGISISSINRIKELAEEKKYVEALEILDTQNLDKSINPQFLRISGEIFRENKRYYDARKYLLKAHQMSPQGLRIIAEIMQLYLELGYFEKAQKYYEQYQFYTSLDDAQKDYVEYMMKKGIGTDVKELASILIPILEQMPEDRWNFEAVLLYDKMGHKDKALDECRFILENFKESSYVKPAIDYIDEKLDVDAYFNVFATKEKKDNCEEFADLRELEDKILEEDFLRMYPPEAKIIVEAEDKELADILASGKDRRVRKKKVLDDTLENTSDSTADEQSDAKPKRKRKSTKKKQEEPIIEEELEQEQQQGDIEKSEPLSPEEQEEAIRKEREAKLDKILSKKTDVEDIKETAKKAVESLKKPDVKKTKKQVKEVAGNVKDNVKKAKDVIEDAVGVKADVEQTKKKAATDIVDGIIEGVIEAPKKSVGQVIVDEELDSLIPDSLESLSAQEKIDIERKKEEEDRIELEALENQLRLEEEKKAKREKRRNKKNSKKKEEETCEEKAEDLNAQSENDKSENVEISNATYEKLKEEFLASNEESEEEQPLESLGFISVVQSDVDDKLEEDMPFAAEILHQMIDNKEFYTGEDSTKFETKASYDNHGFEVEDYEFTSHDGYILQTTHEELYNRAQDEDIPSVEMIYAKQDVMDFDDMIPQEDSSIKDDFNDRVDEQQNMERLFTEQNERANDVVNSDRNIEKAEDMSTENIIAETIEETIDDSVDDSIDERMDEKIDVLDDDSKDDLNESMDADSNNSETEQSVESDTNTHFDMEESRDAMTDMTEKVPMGVTEEAMSEESFSNESSIVSNVVNDEKEVNYNGALTEQMKDLDAFVDAQPLKEVVNDQITDEPLRFAMPNAEETDSESFNSNNVVGDQFDEKEEQLQTAIEDVEKGNIIETYSESSFEDVTDDQVVNSYDENVYQSELVNEESIFHSDTNDEERTDDILLEEDNTWKEEVLTPEVSWDDSELTKDDSAEEKQMQKLDDRNDLRIRIIITSNMSQLLKELKEGR